MFEDGREISRMQMNGIRHFFQGDGMIEVRGNVVHGFFDSLPVFVQGIIKQTVREGFHDFLKLCAQQVQRVYLLKAFQKRIVQLQNIVCGRPPSIATRESREHNSMARALI